MSLLSSEALLLTSLPTSLPVFFRSFLVSLEHAAVPAAPSTTARATIVLTSFLRMGPRLPGDGARESRYILQAHCFPKSVVCQRSGVSRMVTAPSASSLVAATYMSPRSSPR